MKGNINQFIEKIKKLFDKKNRTNLIFAIGIVGILLIFLSYIFERKSDDTSAQAMYDVSYSQSTDEYKSQIETELCQILSEISGVGEVKVMVTIGGTTEYEYAMELVKDSDDVSSSYKNQYVLIDNNGKKEALVKKVNTPQISGVAVVCEGGDDVKVSERIVRAVSTVLDISSTDVCVVPLKDY